MTIAKSAMPPQMDAVTPQPKSRRPQLLRGAGAGAARGADLPAFLRAVLPPARDFLADLEPAVIQSPDLRRWGALAHGILRCSRFGQYLLQLKQRSEEVGQQHQERWLKV